MSTLSVTVISESSDLKNLKSATGNGSGDHVYFYSDSLLCAYNLTTGTPFSFKSTKKSTTHDIVSCHASQQNNSLLFTCSSDGRVILWDLRTESPQMRFSRFKQLESVTYASVASNCDDTVVSAGSEVRFGEQPSDDDDVFLVFWDVRANKKRDVYTELHSNTITSLAFHPTSPHKLLTGSEDGLLCLLDISQASEEDALDQIFNTEDNVQRSGWLPTTCSKDDRFFSLTSLQTCLLWSEDSLKPPLRHAPSSSSASHLLNLVSPSSSDQLLLACKEEESSMLAYKLSEMKSEEENGEPTSKKRKRDKSHLRLKDDMVTLVGEWNCSKNNSGDKIGLHSAFLVGSKNKIVGVGDNKLFVCTGLDTIL